MFLDHYVGSVWFSCNYVDMLSILSVVNDLVGSRGHSTVFPISWNGSQRFELAHLFEIELCYGVSFHVIMLNFDQFAEVSLPFYGGHCIRSIRKVHLFWAFVPFDRGSFHLIM